MRSTTGAGLALGVFALAGCNEFTFLLGKSDEEVARLLGEDMPGVVVREVPVGDAPEETLYIKDATIIAMDGSPPDVGSVLIKDGVIAAMGSDLPVPDDALVIEAGELTLLPGLADMHVHHFSEAEGPLYLANGVTSVRNMWGTVQTTRLDEAAKHHAYPGPRVYTPGPIMDGPEPIWGDGSVELSSPEMAIGAVRAQKAAGFTAVKLYEKLSGDVFRAAAEEARALDMQVYAHTPLSMTVDEVISLKIDSLEHFNNAQDYLVPDDYAWPDDYNTLSTWTVADDGKMAELAAVFAENGVWNAPTLEVTIGRYASALADDAFFASDVGSYVPPGLKQWWSGSAERIKGWATADMVEDARERQLAFLKALYDANAPLLIGTDTPNPFVVAGFSLHGELQSFREAGLPNEAILEIATTEAARFLGEEETFGQVAEGMRADLILVKGDPLADLSVLQAPTAVIAGGRYYDRDALDTMLSDARQRAASGD